MPYKKVPNPWIGRTLWAAVILAVIGGTIAYYWIHPERLPDWAARTPLGQELQTTRVYKWRDTSGAWQVSDQPPPDGVAFEVQTYTRDDNVLPLPPGLRP